MSYDRCLNEARKLKKHLEAQGLQVSIELQRDAKGTWDFWSKRLNMSHHVASYRSHGLTPFLWLVKKGRSDVPAHCATGTWVGTTSTASSPWVSRTIPAPVAPSRSMG